MDRLDLSLVALRDFELEDVKKKVEWINNPLNNVFLHYNIPLNIEDTERWFYSKADNRRDCIIEYEGIPVGLIGLLNIDEDNKEAEYYISLGEKDYKGKGIARKATELILNYAFNSLDLKTVYLNVDAENIKAVNLYSRVGFSQEEYYKDAMFARGKMIDRIRFSITKDSFTNMKMENTL